MIMKRVTLIVVSAHVHTVRTADIGMLYRDQLVAHNYTDEEAATNPEEAPTFQSFTHSLVLSLAVLFRNARKELMTA